MGGKHCLLSAPLLQQRCCQDLVIFSSSVIESVLSKVVERLLTLLYIALLESQKIALNCVNIVVLLFFGFFPGGQQYLLCFCERKLKYSLGYHRLTRYWVYFKSTAWWPLFLTRSRWTSGGWSFDPIQTSFPAKPQLIQISGRQYCTPATGAGVMRRKGFVWVMEPLRCFTGSRSEMELTHNWSYCAFPAHTKRAKANQSHLNICCILTKRTCPHKNHRNGFPFVYVLCLADLQVGKQSFNKCFHLGKSFHNYRSR